MVQIIMLRCYTHKNKMVNWECFHTDSWLNWNVVHNIITRDANSVSWAEIWEFSQTLQCDIINAIIISETIVFDIICFAAYYSAAKFKLPIEEPSNNATKYGIRSQKVLFV